MGRDYSVIKTNVGNDIQDTSTTMSSLIGRYINRRYMQVLRAIDFDIVKTGYTISVVAGTSDYALASDFKKELACIDQTNGKTITRTDFSYYQREDANAITDSGTVDYYIIYTDENNANKIRFINTPSTAITVALPYVVSPTELSAATDEPVLGLEDLVEIGATADALRYKRQYAKAAQYEALFANMYADFIFKQENQPNYPKQFTPTTYSRDNLY